MRSKNREYSLALKLCGILIGASVFLLSTSTLLAKDFVRSKGKLSDRDFYRAVACGAPVGQECRYSTYRWPESDRVNLTVGIMEIEDEFPKDYAATAAGALVKAIEEINGVNSGVRLVQVTKGTPKIKVYFVSGKIGGGGSSARTVTGFALAEGAGGMARIFPGRRKGSIAKAEVYISDLNAKSGLRSIVLEELVQSLGLLTDIHNRYYNKRSIFSEVGSGTTKLRGQDAKALLLHYPPS